ncbi:hypothetical protein F2Q69_00048722 [Brassica cretica]|uniref:Uncharacterized protein n=1 Tax=Brassica cretica TaxID=69181 RepID=A0A8S9PU10_BRACR|nr:hypothetical protein F2Q69_00048722 [Brassica cretica]
MANEPVPHTEGAITQPAHLIKELSSLAAPQTRPATRAAMSTHVTTGKAGVGETNTVTPTHVHLRSLAEGRDKELEIANPQTQPEPDSPDTTAAKPTGGAQHEQLGLLQTTTHNKSTQDTSKPGKPHLERAFLQSKKHSR